MHNNNKRFSPIAFVVIAIIFMAGCNTGKEKSSRIFSKLEPDQSGIRFSNDIVDTDSINSFINEFGYMGGGVGVGDFNNDGLKDLFFTGNQVSSRAYINKGNNKFEDITEKAGLTTDVWATGVSIVDINSDGFDDIYVSVFGKTLVHRAKNLLFINQKNLTFKEQAEAYGLADTSFSTQAAFLDYDRDGDLDMYLANYLLSGTNANYIVPRDRSGRSLANDRLYRNEGVSTGADHPVFTDVTMDAGIKDDGFGLGVSISDVNNDGWPDIYVANDFVSNDLLWLNNHNGTFTNRIAQSLQHQSYSSMGCDAADINNDGRPDILTLDMLPENNQRKKTSFFFMNYERYQSERNMGYEPEFARNMLQLNNGNIATGDTLLPFFSEIGQLAGIHATDWSWSVLLADFNNDGWKDIHVTNGIGRDFINADFLEFSTQIAEVIQDQEQVRREVRRKLASLDHVELGNYLYLNNKDYTFADVSDSAGVNEKSMSNGAAYVDLDNDGDLDLVTNNINREAFVWINHTVEKGEPYSVHYLKVKLAGDSLNKQGFGCKVILYAGGVEQAQEQNPVRGYFSSVDQELLFGLGEKQQLDSVVVIWPDRKRQVVLNVKADALLTLSKKDATGDYPVMPGGKGIYFSEITSGAGISWKHSETQFNDFAMQRLLPHKYSQLGPFLTTGDINGDGVTDIFAGGAINNSGMLFIQQKNQSSFSGRKLVDKEKYEEDLDCILFDADNDKDLDLLVGGGDIQQPAHSIDYKPRLYINDGKGNFTLNASALPDSLRAIAGAIAAADYDGDGDADLFIGGRVSNTYPQIPRSYLLQNNGGTFKDVTASVCPALQHAGMITGAVWTDFDKDNHPDLVIAGEWMEIRFFRNNRTSLQEATGSTGLSQMNGMWKSLVAADIDKDGDEDLVAGNLGLNCTYRVSSTEPMELFATDMDGNSSIDPIMFYYIKDNDGVRRLRPGISRSQFSDQVPAVKKQFLYSTDYGKAGVDEIFKGKNKEAIQHLTCNETRSCWFENTGNGKFVKHVLPLEAQFAPVNAIICDDIDNDGQIDLVMAGNDYQSDVMTGRYDASYGCLLKGAGEKNFVAVPPVQSGLLIRGDVRDMVLVKTAGGDKIIVAGINNDSLRLFKIMK